jgi:hypothetical protein
MFAGAGLLAYLQYAEIQQLQRQLELQDTWRAQLLERVELNTSQRLDFERQIATLERNLSSANNQLTNMSLALQEARENVDHDIDSIREVIRSEVEQELQSEQPASIQALIARTMTPERMEQQARLQVTMQYGEFLSELDTDADRKAQLQKFLIEITTHQVEMSSRFAAGKIELEEMSAATGPDFLADQLSSVLTAEEMNQFKEYEAGNTERQMRRNYSLQLEMSAPGLTSDNREIVLNSLIHHSNSRSIDVDLEQEDPAGSLFTSQLEAIYRTRQELESQLDNDQFREASNFLDQMQSTYEMTQEMARELRLQPDN